MSGSRIALMLTGMLSVPVAVLGGDDAHGDGESPYAGQALVMLMHGMQYNAHKLGLAIDASNKPLQGFYLHELEEVIEAVGGIDRYDDIAIAHLLNSTLKPAFDALDAAIEEGDAPAADAAYDKLLDRCNACHRSAHRPFIVIERNHDNPYLQNFTPQP